MLNHFRKVDSTEANIFYRQICRSLLMITTEKWCISKGVESLFVISTKNEMSTNVEDIQPKWLEQ